MFKGKLKIAVVFFILIFFAGLMSCNKSKQTSDTDANNSENLETEAIGQNDFTEKDEDLLNVDYKEFYDELSPYGEWIEVTDKDIDLKMNKSSAAGDKSHRTISISQLFGVKDAYADDMAFGAFFIWQPSPNLAVTVATGEPSPYYVPYSNGQWINTDAGWYFMAPTPYEEVVHHHGRWVFSPELGWVWIPGRVWAPAWVDWRVGLGYVAWEPLPPSIYIVNNYIMTPPVYEDRFIIVENRYFCEPQIYRYNYVYSGYGDRIMIKNMTRVDGVMVRDNIVINHGPDVSIIEKDRGSKLDMVKLTKVNRKGDSRFDGKEIKSYSPEFSRVKTKGDLKTSAIKPGKFESFGNAKNKGSKNDQFTQKDNRNGNPKDNNSKGIDKSGSGSDSKFKNDNRSNGNNKDYNRQNDNNKKNSDYGKQRDGNNKGNRKSDNNSDKGQNKGGNYDKGQNKGGNYDKGQNKGGNYDKGRNKGGNNDKGGQNKGGNERKKFNNKQSQKDYNGRSNDGGKKKFNYRNENYGKQNNQNGSRKYNDQKTQKERNSKSDSRSSGSSKQHGKR